MADRADGQPVFLEEIEGDGRLSVVFNGPELPEQGVEVGRETRLVENWYPGAEAASVQIVGPKEYPIPLSGWLRDVLTGFDGGALEVMQRLERIRHRQRVCQLQWGEVINVKGFLRESRFQIQRETDIHYDLVCFVAEAQAAEVSAATPFPETSEADLISVLDSTLAYVEDVAGTVVANFKNNIRAIL